MKLLLLSIPAAILLISSCASKYDVARDLYREGPSKAPQIIALLQDHIESHPKDDNAYRLLGITQFGTSRNVHALESFNKAIELQKEKGEVSPNILMLKARTLYSLERKKECKQLLKHNWAFWQNDPELKSQYEWYWQRL